MWLHLLHFSYTLSPVFFPLSQPHPFLFSPSALFPGSINILPLYTKIFPVCFPDPSSSHLSFFTSHALLCSSSVYLGIFLYRVLFRPSRMPWTCILLKTSDIVGGLSRSHFVDNKTCVFAYACPVMSHFIWNFIKILLSFGLLTKYWPFSIFHIISPISNFRFRQYIWCFIFSALVLHLNFLRLLSASCTVHKRFLQLNGFFLLMHIKHGCS